MRNVTRQLVIPKKSRFVFRFKHITSANVYIRNITAQSTRWPRHCQPVSRDHWTAHIPDTGYRSNFGYRRWLASIIRWDIHFFRIYYLVFKYISNCLFYSYFIGLAICPAMLQLILLPLCPESPRYLLITKQWEEEARKGEYLNHFF